MCDRYRPPTKTVMFTAHTPALQSMEDIELIKGTINHVIKTGIENINLPVLEADLIIQRDYNVRKLVQL